MVVQKLDDRDANDALRQRRALELLGLYRAMPLEAQQWPHIARLMARLETAGGTLPAAEAPRRTSPRRRQLRVPAVRALR